MSKFKFPTAFTILFALIILVAIATWFVPAGKYDRVINPILDKEVPVPGTYHLVEANPQGPVEVFMAPIAGLYDPISYTANAIDVAVFVLVIGGFLMVVTRTGAIDAGIAKIMTGLKGRENLMIPILMAFFAAGGTIYGMAEESLAFYALIIPVMIRAGYDSMTGVAVILLGAGIGTLGSTINPFATVIASNAAGVPFTDGIGLRFLILIVGWLVCVAWVMRYAAKVKADHTSSLVSEMKEENEKHFLQGVSTDDIPDFTAKHGWIMAIFVVTFGLLIYGVAVLGWWMGEMAALFLAASILVGIVARQGEHEFVDNFLDGARDLLGVALIIGVARGIVVVMDAGSITDTILYWSEQAVSGLSKVAFINVMFWLELVLSFFVPSSSGLAVLSMPIMAPLAGFSNVGAEYVVTAFQSASGLLNLFNPTFAVVMGGLAIGRVPYDKWLRFAIPLVIILFVLISLALSLSV
ncbi:MULTISPECIES: YfcC family protein [Pseudovibrio]|uniref:Uncharacterized membrane protein YfcC, ion transporter superfamily n=1 Tax=Pseudovibrio ascidiaceicola TaxID=285279 RepID=A0A1I3YIH4_9HYPH|nr:MULTISPECIES: YfcC family protein [Pseudovibrio]KZL14378.1 hypothetical protein PsAD26_01289 [Pseudovibrio sp. Ad26]SFK31590.1 Uncharacterized membrane protein YfcC, ion transporter superfamily [Pseudovibrio ascidiaceicola]